MKVSDYIAEFIAGIGIDTAFVLTGGCAFNDRFNRKEKDIGYVAVNMNKLRRWPPKPTRIKGIGVTVVTRARCNKFINRSLLCLLRFHSMIIFTGQFLQLN